MTSSYYASSLPLASGYPSSGTLVERARTFVQTDFDRFAVLSGDDNPIHVDPAFAARTKFGRTVAHGMLLYSSIEALLRAAWPGWRAVSQTLKFPFPTFTAEPVRMQAEILAVDNDTGLITLATRVIKADGSPGLEGEAQLAPPGVWLDNANVPADLSTATGPRATLQRTCTLADGIALAALTGDAELHPATATIPGGLLGSLFSCLLGTELPGPGTNYLKQRLEYRQTAAFGEALTASVEIVRVRPDKHLVNLRTVCVNAVGDLICDGEALVLVNDLASKPLSDVSVTGNQ